MEPDPENREATTLELDELWSFVLKKAHKRWIWIALSRRTREVVAYAIGDRSQATCEKLWKAIPEAYRTAHCDSDFWKAYAAVIPAESTYGGRYQEWADGICGALQLHVAAAVDSLGAADVIVLKV